MIQKRKSDHLKNAEPRTEKATIARPRETRNCIATTQNRLVRVISTNGLHNGLITHGKYSQLVYRAISVGASQHPARLVAQYSAPLRPLQRFLPALARRANGVH